MDIPRFQFIDKFYQQLLLIVKPNTSVIDVMHQMNQTQASCALVVEQQQLVGIFTQRDVVRGMCNIKHLHGYTQHTTFEEITIAEFMNQPVITLSEREAEDLATVIERFQQYRIHHLPVIDNGGQVLRVITPPEVIERLCESILDFGYFSTNASACRRQRLRQRLKSGRRRLRSVQVLDFRFIKRINSGASDQFRF